MSGISTKAELVFTNNFLVSILKNFLEITPSYYCYYRLFSYTDVDCSYYTPPVIYPSPDVFVNAWAYLGNRNVDFLLYTCPAPKFNITGPLAVEPNSSMNPDFVATTTFYYYADELPPPIIINRQL